VLRNLSFKRRLALRYPTMFTMVKASEIYPKPQLCRDQRTREDADLDIPFTEVAGEAVTYLGETAEPDGVIALSNYRLHISRYHGSPFVVIKGYLHYMSLRVTS
jgi:hypothetical protein